MKKTTETTKAPLKAAAKKADTAPVTGAPVEPTVDPLAAALVEVPAKVCVQIGQRKRYFATREEALAALKEFTDKQNKPKGPARTFLTAEQKAEKAEKRNKLLAYAGTQGLEGKKAAMLANVLEDLCHNIPACFDLIANYEPAVEAPEEPATEETPASTDPLADFL